MGIDVLFLEDGAQPAESVASWIAAIVADARVSVDLAIYDAHLEGEAAKILTGALAGRRDAGVRVRIVHHADGTPCGEGSVAEPAHCDLTASFFADAGFQARPVRDGGRLMHHKFFVVDAATPAARVITGSANLTMAGFTRQENNLLALPSPTLATAYTTVFDELWRTGRVAGSGDGDGVSASVDFQGSPVPVEVRFAPGDGVAIDREVARRIASVEKEITIASVVLSSEHVLDALREAVDRGVPLSGVVDLAQMGPILAAWRRGASAWKAEVIDDLARRGLLHGKRAVRGAGGGPHDYMHDKVIVVDDTVITGSYNFSAHAEQNAENILFIQSPAVAALYRQHVAKLVDRYPPIRPPD